MARFCRAEDGNLTIVLDEEWELDSLAAGLARLKAKYDPWPPNGIAFVTAIKEQDAQG